MPDNKKPILIGSIIHLKNEFRNGGYLETRGRINDKPVITHWHDEHIRAFVFTHEEKNRSKGSGSWQIISATGKNNGEPLLLGDKIHLLNMYSGAGYLDSFEWVERLEPFKNYPMNTGVFTASVPKRGGGPSGTWTIQSATTEESGNEVNGVVEGDAIYLENDYPGAGFLHSYGAVTKHDLFKKEDDETEEVYKYDHQLLFVFTGPSSGEAKEGVVAVTEGGSRKWTITLNDPSEHLYRVYTQMGDESAPWHNEGILKIKDEKAINEGKTREVVSLKIDNTIPDDNHDTLIGRITYKGETEIAFKAIRPKRDDGSLLRDYFNPGLLKGRTIKIEGMMDVTYRLLRDSFDEMSSVLLVDALKKINVKKDEYRDDVKRAKFEYDGEVLNVESENEKVVALHSYQGKLTAAIEKYEANLNSELNESQSNNREERLEKHDHTFQIKQLLNLYELSRILNNFFWHELQDDMKQSLENHQRAQTLAPLHLLRKCARHVAMDHEIIQQAATQRRWHRGLTSTKPNMGEQAKELLLMDKLAFKAIAPFQHLLPGAPEPSTIITYLSDRTLIHNLPYTNRFILVGVSYDRVPPAAGFFDNEVSTENEFYAYELMAIPHEVGHHIYQHGTLSDGRTFIGISEHFEDSNPYYHWCEEIFADLYGCIIAGPLSVLGMQALLMSIDRHRAWKDDEEHPTPAIRFFILTEMLRLLPDIGTQIAKTRGKESAWAEQTNFDNVADELDKRWAIMIERWGYKRADQAEGRPTRIYLPDESALYLDRLVNVERVINGVRPIIIEFATHLLNEIQSTNNDSTPGELVTRIPWSSTSEEKLVAYNKKMQELTGDSIASQKVPHQTFVNAMEYSIDRGKLDPDKILQEYLDNWGDRGPHGWGDNG